MCLLLIGTFFVNAQYVIASFKRCQRYANKGCARRKQEINIQAKSVEFPSFRKESFILQ